jgi:hypothetical protein
LLKKDLGGYPLYEGVYMDDSDRLLRKKNWKRDLATRGIQLSNLQLKNSPIPQMHLDRFLSREEAERPRVSLLSNSIIQIDKQL